LVGGWLDAPPATNQLGRLPAPQRGLLTVSVENSVEKVRLRARLRHDPEQFSGLHYRGAMPLQQPQIILALINAS